MAIPAGMIPVTALTGAVEIASELHLKHDEEGNPKENANFPGRIAYGTRVEVVTGYREKTMPDGQSLTLPELKNYPLTIWTENAIDLPVGTYVYLQNLYAGMVDKTVYLWTDNLALAAEVSDGQ